MILETIIATFGLLQTTYGAASLTMHDSAPADRAPLHFCCDGVGVSSRAI